MYIYVKPDLVPPRAALETAVKNNREMYGAAIVVDGKVICQNGITDLTDEKAFVDSLVKYAEDYKSSVRVFWLSNEITDEQPFSIFNEGETEHAAVILLDGDYDKHMTDVGEDDEHGAHWHAFQKFFKPRFDKLATDVEGDPEKFYEGIASNPKEYDQSFSEDSCFAVLVGKPERLCGMESSESVAKEFTWGSMSNPYDYVEQTAAATPKPGLLSGPAPKSGATPKAAGLLDTAVGKTVLVNMSPPKTIKTKKEGDAWYQHYNFKKDENGIGIIPEGWPKKRVAVDVDKAVLERGDFPGTAPKTDTAVAVVAATPKPGAAATPKGATPKTGNGVHRVPFSPTLTAGELTDMTNGWKAQGFINEVGKTAADLAKNERPFPSFHSITDVDIYDLVHHSNESLDYLVSKHPKLAVIALRNALSLLPDPKKAAATPKNKPGLK